MREPNHASPAAHVELLIHKSVDEVFEAFVDPDITTKFWFTHSTGRLCEAQRVRWEWRMFGVETEVAVLELEQGRRIVMEWGAPGEPVTTVEWKFQSRDGATNVVVDERGFAGEPAQQVAAAVESTEGFTLVLAGAKAWLEHGVQLNLIVDRHPDAVKPAQRVS
jgi:uncharacterized protein YndB with AHSA1/START domain